MWKLIPKKRTARVCARKKYGSSHSGISTKRGMRLNSAYPFV